MSEDIRLLTGLPHHPKMLKLERRLGPAGCWAFVKLLLWAGDTRPDGNLKALTDEDIELAVGWTEPKPFVPVLAEIGFLDGTPGTYRVHDWAEHQPYVSTRPERTERARAAARARWDKTTPEERKEVGRTLVEARQNLAAEDADDEPEDPTCSQRATSTSTNVPTTCAEHIHNVPPPSTPSTPSEDLPSASFLGGEGAKPPNTINDFGRTERDLSPQNGDMHTNTLNLQNPETEIPEIVNTLGVRELKGLQKTLQRTLRDRRMPSGLRDSTRQRLNQVMTLLRSKGTA
jgi:hypothetical protein